MEKVKLGDVAIEKRETWTGSTQGVPSVGLEHLVPGEVTLSSWDSDTDNTFSKMFRKGQVLLGRRRVYLKKAVIAPFDGICSGDITVIEAIPGKISSRLLPFVIQNERFFDYAMQGSAGSLSPRVKWEDVERRFVVASGSRRETARLARARLDRMVQPKHRLRPLLQGAVRNSGDGCRPCVDKRRRNAHLALREGDGLAVERRHGNCIWRGRDDICRHRTGRQKRRHSHQPRRRGVLDDGFGTRMRSSFSGRRCVRRRLRGRGRFAQGLCADGRANVPDRRRRGELERAAAALRAAFRGGKSA